jgi:carbon monoxide dehydrogenase subunit G
LPDSTRREYDAGMAVKIDVRYHKPVESSRSAEETFRFLTDFEHSIPEHFPGVEKFEKLGNDTYRWTFERFAQGGYDLQIKLVTRFAMSAPQKIGMSSLPEPGASQISGGWRVDAEGSRARVDFEANLSLELPIPFLLKAVAAPLAQKELSKLFDRYLENVGKALAQ